MKTATNNLVVSKQVNISDVNLGKITPRDEQNINELAESIRTVGIIEPVVLNKDMAIISGRRRIIAANSAGLTSVPAIIVTRSTLDEELAVIDSNLMHLPLGDVEHDHSLLRRKQIFELKYPETKQHVAGGKATEQQSFTEETATKLDISRRTVEKAIARAQKASPAVTQARRNGLGSSKVDELVKLPQDLQEKLAPLAMNSDVGLLKLAVKAAEEGSADRAVAILSGGKQGPSVIDQIGKHTAKLTSLTKNAIEDKGKYEVSDLKPLFKDLRKLRASLKEFMDLHRTLELVQDVKEMETENSLAA